MKARLLPGNSIKNEKWAEEIWEEMEDLFEEFEIQNYDSWDSDEYLMNLDYETGVLKSEFEDGGLIIAQSFGVALALKAISEEKIKPRACVFIGTPVIFCESNKIPLEKWIKGYEVPTFFIQNDDDPAMDADELKDYLYENKVKNFKFRVFDSETHEYNNFGEIKEVVKGFLKGLSQ